MRKKHWKPRYVTRKMLASGWGYFFEPPTSARAAGCPVHAEPLGPDHNEAFRRAETVLLPAFDAWCRGGASDEVKPDAPARAGSLDWLFATYRADRRFTKLPSRSRRNAEAGMRLVGGHVMKDGQRLGTVRLTQITAAVVDQLYDKLLVVRKTDAYGNVIERERRTTVNGSMRACRRAWNVVARSHGKLPHANPFAGMGLESSDRETPPATLAELQAFRAAAKEMGYPSLATAALIAWEWVQRREDIFGKFEAAHYRPKERPNSARVIHAKTREEAWWPLFDDKGVPLHPELQSELDAIKRERIGGLMIVRDWGDRAPWPTWPRPDAPELSYMSRIMKKIVRAAGLRPELTLRSFRHGGFTEMGDAALTDGQIRAQGRHKSAKVLPRYVHRTERQIAEGTQKRRAIRGTNRGQDSEWSTPLLSE
jgi:hypothetical protein